MFSPANVLRYTVSGTPKQQQILIKACEMDAAVWPFNGTVSAYLVK